MIEQVKTRKRNWHTIYRLVLRKDETLEEVGSYRLTLLNIYILLSSLILVAMGLMAVVIFFTPLKRLVYTWARPNEVDDESKHSRVSFDIEQYSDGLVRLTVAHDDLAKDPKMLAGVSGGWPTVLSNLKTFLETGRALPQSAAAG